MPITPFHFGPGAIIHSSAPRHISFLAFCAANVLIDVEPLYYMMTGQFRLHRFFHTYIGATLVALMHADIRPFAPFSDANPLLGLVSLRALHLFCVIAGAAGVLVVLVRSAAVRSQRSGVR